MRHVPRERRLGAAKENAAAESNDPAMQCDNKIVRGRSGVKLGNSFPTVAIDVNTNVNHGSQHNIVQPVINAGML
jgi:hypothetical protein